MDQTKSKQEPAESGVCKLVAEIRKLQQEEGVARSQVIRCRIRQGQHLVQLREQVSKGKWGEICKDLGLSERNAQRLMELGRSWLAADTRTTGTGMLDKLPLDLQKLTALCRLSEPKLKKFVVKHDLDEMSRGQVREAVNVALSDRPRAPEYVAPVKKPAVSATAPPPRTAPGEPGRNKRRTAVMPGTLRIAQDRDEMSEKSIVETFLDLCEPLQQASSDVTRELSAGSIEDSLKARLHESVARTIEVLQQIEVYCSESKPK